MKFRGTRGGIPAGTYTLRFETVSPFEGGNYGPSVKFELSVVEGEFAGKTTSRITSAEPTPKNACGRMISGLTGEQIKPDQDYDLEACVGQIYLGVVVETDKGGTRVDTVILSHGSTSQGSEQGPEGF